MENSKKKLTGIEKNFIRSLNRNAQAIQKQKDRITQRVEKFVAENKVKTDELEKLLTDIDNNIKSYTGGLTFEDHFGEESNDSDNDIDNTQRTTIGDNSWPVSTERETPIRSPFDEESTNTFGDDPCTEREISIRNSFNEESTNTQF